MAIGKILAVAAVLSLAVSETAFADQFVNGYYRSNGTYVAPHYRSDPDQYRFNNYSSQGNTNPHTGERGYQRNEFSSPPAYNQSFGGHGSQPLGGGYWGR